MNDILKINIIEIINDNIIFTCSNIHMNDYMIHDYIQIINNDKSLKNKMEHILKITKIKDNLIYCKNSNHNINKNGKYDNIDMKIKNLSNQNMIYINLES